MTLEKLRPSLDRKLVKSALPFPTTEKITVRDLLKFPQHGPVLFIIRNRDRLVDETAGALRKLES